MEQKHVQSRNDVNPYSIMENGEQEAIKDILAFGASIEDKLIKIETPSLKDIVPANIWNACLFLTNKERGYVIEVNGIRSDTPIDSNFIRKMLEDYERG